MSERAQVFKSTRPLRFGCDDCEKGLRWVALVDGAMYHFYTWDKAMDFVRWELTDESG